MWSLDTVWKGISSENSLDPLLLKQSLGNTGSAAWGTAHSMTTGYITTGSHFTDESQL